MEYSYDFSVLNWSSPLADFNPVKHISEVVEMEIQILRSQQN